MEEIFAAELDKPDVDYIRNNPPLKPPKSRPIELKNTVEPTIHYAEIVKLSRQDTENINRDKSHTYRNNTHYIKRPQLLEEIKAEIERRQIPKEEKKHKKFPNKSK